jgi:hypothetical protein
MGFVPQSLQLQIEKLSRPRLLFRLNPSADPRPGAAVRQPVADERLAGTGTIRARRRRAAGWRGTALPPLPEIGNFLQYGR